MLDPTEQRKNGFRAAADRTAQRAADRAAAAPPPPSPVTPAAPRPSLASLYARFDALVADGAHDDGSDLQAAILARLSANRRHAEEAGWTAFSFERDTTTGRVRLVGVAPASDAPTLVPDWTARVAADAVARGAAARPHHG